METVKRKRISFQKKDNIYGTLMAVVPLVGFAIFGLIPALIAFWLAFQKVKGFDLTATELVWFDNYAKIIKDDDFLLAIKNTFLAAIGMPITVVASLFIALLLKNGKWGTQTFRIILFIPYVCSVAAISTMWKWMLDRNFGIINSMLNLAEPIDWLGDSDYFMPAIIAMGVWSGTGFGTILYSAALGNIPRTYYEAAKIDGANSFTQFVKITLPGISPTTFFLVTTGLIGAMQDFARFQIMGGNYGGPNKSGLTIVFYLWQSFNQNLFTQGVGVAAAVGVMLAIAIALITVSNFFLSKLWVHYD